MPINLWAKTFTIWPSLPEFRFAPTRGLSYIRKHLTNTCIAWWTTPTTNQSPKHPRTWWEEDKLIRFLLPFCYKHCKYCQMSLFIVGKEIKKRKGWKESVQEIQSSEKWIFPKKMEHAGVKAFPHLKRTCGLDVGINVLLLCAKSTSVRPHCF